MRHQSSYKLGFLFIISFVMISVDGIAADGGETTLYVDGDGEGSRPGEVSPQVQLIQAIYKKEESTSAVKTSPEIHNVPKPVFKPADWDQYVAKQKQAEVLNKVKNIPVPERRPDNWEEIVKKQKAVSAEEKLEVVEDKVSDKPQESAPTAQYKKSLDLKKRLSKYVVIVKRLQQDLETMDVRVGNTTTLGSCAPMHGHKLKEFLQPAKKELQEHAKRIEATLIKLDAAMKSAGGSLNLKAGAICGKAIANQLSDSLEKPIVNGVAEAEQVIRREYSLLVSIDKKLDEKHSGILYLYNSPSKRECLAGQSAYLDGRTQYKKLQSELVSLQGDLSSERAAVHSYVAEVSKTQSCKQVASN